MPNLFFELTDRVCHHLLEAEETRKELTFKAALSKEPNLKGNFNTVMIEDGKLSLKRLQQASVKIVEGNKKSAELLYCSFFEPENKLETYTFEIKIEIPYDIFYYLLKFDVNNLRLFLNFQTEVTFNEKGTATSGLTFGFADDGSEKIWDIKKQNPIPAKEFGFTTI
jgi:hypothetical protein